MFSIYNEFIFCYVLALSNAEYHGKSERETRQLTRYARIPLHINGQFSLYLPGHPNPSCSARFISSGESYVCVSAYRSYSIALPLLIFFAALQNHEAYSATVMSGLYSPSGSAMSRQSPLSSPTFPLTQTAFLLANVVLCQARTPDRRLHLQ